MRVRGHAVLHAELRGQSLALRFLAVAGAAIICSLTTPPSRNPSRTDAEHSFIVAVMKPAVYVPWYQVLPWILSGGAVGLAETAEPTDRSLRLRQHRLALPG